MHLKIIINIISTFLLITLSTQIGHTTLCDTLGNCSIIMDSNETFIPMPNSFSIPAHYIKDPPQFVANQTEQIISPQEGYKGISKNGIIKNTKNNYECTGGLNECIDSCCLNGFCVKLLYICDIKKQQFTTIYILTVSMFALFAILYWSMFFSIGLMYNIKYRTRIPEMRISSKKSLVNVSHSTNQPFDDNKIHNEIKNKQIDLLQHANLRITEINEEDLNDSSFDESFQEKCKTVRKKFLEKIHTEMNLENIDNDNNSEKLKGDEYFMSKQRSQQIINHPIIMNDSIENNSNETYILKNKKIKKKQKI